MTSASLHPIIENLMAVERAGRRARFVAGLVLPLKAAGFLLGHPALWAWAILPALINLFIFALTATGLIWLAPSVLGMVWSQPEVMVWTDWFWRGLWYVLFVIVVIASVALAYFVVLLVSSVVASPFNDKLSQLTEESLSGTVRQARPDESTAASIIRSVAHSLGALLLYLACLLPLLPLHLIPGAGSLLYTVFAMGVSAFFLALGYSDNTLDRQGLDFSQKVATIRREFDISMGFGAGTTLLLLIPLVNLVTMPIAVVGGTILGMTLRDWKGGTKADETASGRTGAVAM
jgi:CysZ protein